MILVTLGTHPQPMDRLVRRLDQLVESGAITDRVILQAPALTYRPRFLDVRPVLPYRALMELLREAEVVISHAGPATLAGVRLFGKAPVVVPRSKRHGEHVDDHQEFYARRIAQLSGYVVVTDLDRLPQAIEEARAAAVEIPLADVSVAVAALESTMDCRR